MYPVRSLDLWERSKSIILPDIIGYPAVFYYCTMAGRETIHKTNADE